MKPIIIPKDAFRGVQETHERAIAQLKKELEERAAEGSLPAPLSSSPPITVTTAQDVDDVCISAALDVFEDWYDNDEPIDWGSFWDRLEQRGFCVADTECRAAIKIQKNVRAHRDLT
jgi:hypothetical protein